MLFYLPARTFDRHLATVVILPFKYLVEQVTHDAGEFHIPVKSWSVAKKERPEAGSLILLSAEHAQRHEFREYVVYASVSFVF